MSDPGTSVSITRGRAIIYRMFDVAEAIDLAAVEQILLHRAGSSRLSIAGRQAIVVRDAPVSLSLGASTLRLGATPVVAETYARLWNYGAVSLQFHVALQAGTSWGELVSLAALAEDDNDVDAAARRRLDEVRLSLAAALKLPHEPAAEEDYIIYLLEEIEGATAADLAQHADIPALILGEPHLRLSEQTCARILGSSFSYSDRDRVVIDWNSAVIVDPSSGRELADVLEFAVSQLMEFRYFDDILDQRLERLYDSIEERRGSSLLRRDYEHVSREASSLYLEFSDNVERVENSVKFVGDPYLATVFRAAAARLNLKEWEESVSRKLGALARTSELLQAEVNVTRSHFLEIVIIVLILYEIISAIWIR